MQFRGNVEIFASKFAHMRKKLYLCSMNPKTQENLYRTDRTFGKVLNGAVYGMLCLFILVGVDTLLVHWGVDFRTFSAGQTILLVYKYLWKVCGIIAGVSIVVRMVLSPFVKSEEQEEFEQKVDYVLQQREAYKKEQTITDYSPLCNLSDEQEAAILKVLHDLPSHSEKSDTINLACVAQYLTALEQMGKANLSNKHHLRLWVARVTGKVVPSSSQFNEAIPSTAMGKVSKIRKELEHLIS